MQKGIHKGASVIDCINCITNKKEELIFHDGILVNRNESEKDRNNIPFVGPGLIDLQINGINGIDFNNPSLTKEDIVNATSYLLSKGVTHFFPTVVTNSDENFLKIVDTIYQTCLSDPLVNNCIWGIHLEGPFISAVAGAKGAHDEKYIKAPDWELFCKFQKAAGGKIKLITIAPEWDGAFAFIKKCKDNGVLVAIGHSMANEKQISMAVNAGATLSTHLGNGVPLLLPRHPNIIWDQLAAEELYACIITDGIHIPDSFIKVVMKNKASATILVSDATCFAGMPPGEYQTHIGGTVILDNEKRLSLKSSPGLLAGATKSLLENVAYLVEKNLATPGIAWQMASSNVVKLLAGSDDSFNSKNDIVLFQSDGKNIHVECVIKNGRIVFLRNNFFDRMEFQL